MARLATVRLQRVQRCALADAIHNLMMIIRACEWFIVRSVYMMEHEHNCLAATVSAFGGGMSDDVSSAFVSVSLVS
jgi:hypothetical protein